MNRLFQFLNLIVQKILVKLHATFYNPRKINPYEGHTLLKWVNRPSWKGIKLVFANFMHTKWFYLVMGIVFALFPWPWSKPYDFKAIIQDIFARLGVFYVAMIFVLGPPTFEIDDAPLKSQRHSLAILSFLVVLYLGSRYFF